MSPNPWIVLVGGFLGAGKTTLLLAAAEELERRGLRSALILNDQGEALVDTELASLRGLPNGQVTGGCFCCRFSELVDVMARLRAHLPDVIFAEPVGSCTDIAATILHPLQTLTHGWRIAPFTVLIDPQRAEALMASDADPHLSFLFSKQVEEADLLCFTKSDIPIEVPAVPGRTVRQISARTGQGVAAWLDEVLSGQLSAGGTLLDLDYEQYARAEAALAWLNAQVTIHPAIPISPAALLGPLLDGLDRAFTEHGIAIVHMKAIVSAETGFIKAALCGNRQEPAVEGMLDASPAAKHELLLNLRAVGKADEVQTIVECHLAGLQAQLTGLRIASFHPSPPGPERRIMHPVKRAAFAAT